MGPIIFELWMFFFPFSICLPRVWLLDYHSILFDLILHENDLLMFLFHYFWMLFQILLTKDVPINEFFIFFCILFNVAHF